MSDNTRVNVQVNLPVGTVISGESWQRIAQEKPCPDCPIVIEVGLSPDASGLTVARGHEPSCPTLRGVCAK